MKRRSWGTTVKGRQANSLRLALERGRGGAPGTPPPPLPPAKAAPLLLRPPPLPGTPPFKLHGAALPSPTLWSRWPQPPGLQPHRRRRRREKPTHFGALSSPHSTSISPAAAGSPAPLRGHFLLPSRHTCPPALRPRPRCCDWQIRPGEEILWFTASAGSGADRGGWNSPAEPSAIFQEAPDAQGKDTFRNVLDTVYVATLWQLSPTPWVSNRAGSVWRGWGMESPTISILL